MHNGECMMWILFSFVAAQEFLDVNGAVVMPYNSNNGAV